MPALSLTAYQPSAVAVSTFHEWTQVRKGKEVQHSYRLDHADPTCPEAVAAEGVGTLFLANEDLTGWPCGSCFVDGTPVDSAPNGEWFDSMDAPSGGGSGGATKPAEPATDKQRNFLGALLRGSLAASFKDGTLSSADVEDSVLAVVTANASKRDASRAIDALVGKHKPVWDAFKTAAPAAPAKPATGLDLTDLPAGRYAVPGADTRLKVMVQKPDKGKWAGWVFVKDAAEYGEGRRYGSQRPGQSYKGDIRNHLETILSDPAAAMAKYGEITDHCGYCGRKLEDKDSVERGIGPVCIKKLGW
jgi:hypothetical protein